MNEKQRTKIFIKLNDLDAMFEEFDLLFDILKVYIDEKANCSASVMSSRILLDLVNNRYRGIKKLFFCTKNYIFSILKSDEKI